MSSEVFEAKAARDKMLRELEIQKAKWPHVNWLRQQLEAVVEENHFAERLRRAQEGNSDRL